VTKDAAQRRSWTFYEAINLPLLIQLFYSYQKKARVSNSLGSLNSGGNKGYLKEIKNLMKFYNVIKSVGKLKTEKRWKKFSTLDP